jgi:hypothetical protein
MNSAPVTKGDTAEGGANPLQSDPLLQTDEDGVPGVLRLEKGIGDEEIKILGKKVSNNGNPGGYLP